MVCGRTDPLITPKIFARDRARLDAVRVAYDVHLFDGAHEVPEAELAAVATS
jgi:predicted esterase